ncbi:MAG TPA: hypothetical protein P5060_02660 [Candidatus Absconditabacterales bacterium]|nr:hypothetical protein [Candidatus Absconditabacterales bacterium]
MKNRENEMCKTQDISFEETIISSGERVNYTDFNKSKSLFDILVNKKTKEDIDITDFDRMENLKKFINKKVYKVVYLEIINNKHLSEEEKKLFKNNHPKIYNGYSNSWNQNFNYLILLTKKGVKIPIRLGGIGINITFRSGHVDQYILGGEKGSLSKANLDFIREFIDAHGNSPEILNKLEKKKIKLSSLVENSL